ncbi:hypothetical protein R5R35_002971 [Gryllus longicercus]|uniref:rRNA adenine N(6)-methyltransferase n=1 Tax=Gryllus longicercus TaxID=2509291 RepID=A0AAN9VDR0_9ORTH
MGVEVAVRLPPLPSIRDIISLYKINALRKLSQNFLLDTRIIDRIVKTAGRIEDGYVCEVGPGPGGITRSILKRNPRRVIVIEKDKRFLPSLELLADASQGHMDIILGDVMSYKMDKVFPDDYCKPWDGPPPNIHLIGNLPFNVSTPLIIKWMKSISEKNSAWTYGRTKMTLTFQKEVAERLVAPISSDQRCRLSVMCQNWCKITHKFTIPGTAFLPKPEVDVGVVHFEPLVQPIINLPFEIVEKVVRCIFSFRQKYCVRGIETLFPKKIRVSFAKEMYEIAEVNPQTQPFRLNLEEFRRLCEAYKLICDRDPRLLKYNHRASKMELEEFEDLNNDLLSCNNEELGVLK